MTPPGTDARSEILERIRRAQRTGHDTAAGGDDLQSAPSGTGQAPAAPDPASVLDLFAERVEDYRASVTRCGADQLPATLARALEGCGSVVVPTGFDDDALTEVTATRVAESEVGDPRDLERVDAVVTMSAVGIAETGTVVLDHDAGQGARALSLVPDLHVCLVRTGQVVPDVPQAVAALGEAVRAGRPLTWISGPSATSDIELDRVEGVHGPRTLHVVLLAD